MQLPTSEPVLPGPWHRPSIKRKLQCQSTIYLTYFRYISQDAMSHTRKVPFSPPYKKPECIPSSGVHHYDCVTHTWGIEHNKREEGMTLLPVKHGFNPGIKKRGKVCVIHVCICLVYARLLPKHSSWIEKFF